MGPTVSVIRLKLSTNQLSDEEYQITVYKDHEVMDQGPYSLIRHPGMGGILINWLGISSWINHPYGWALYGLILRDTYFHTLSEEKEFEKNLPSYSDYMKRVPA